METQGSYTRLEDTDGEVFADFSEACALFDAVAVDPSNRAKNLEASSSVYWVMLQHVTARQYCLDA